MSGSPPILLVVAAVVARAGRVLLTRRSAGTHLEGHWEFPGGKVEPGEAPPAALRREMREELGVECRVGAPLAFNYHEYPGVRVLLLAYRASITGRPRPIGCAAVGWYGARQVRRLALPAADGPILERLAAVLRRRPSSRAGRRGISVARGSARERSARGPGRRR